MIQSSLLLVLQTDPFTLLKVALNREDNLLGFAVQLLLSLEFIPSFLQLQAQSLALELRLFKLLSNPVLFVFLLLHDLLELMILVHMIIDCGLHLINLSRLVLVRLLVCLASRAESLVLRCEYIVILN